MLRESFTIIGRVSWDNLSVSHLWLYDAISLLNVPQCGKIPLIPIAAGSIFPNIAKYSGQLLRKSSTDE